LCRRIPVKQVARYCVAINQDRLLGTTLCIDFNRNFEGAAGTGCAHR
jgi:homoaconitase/3-isopropylmalate dehydratase large subunit